VLPLLGLRDAPAAHETHAATLDCPVKLVGAGRQRQETARCNILDCPVKLL